MGSFGSILVRVMSVLMVLSGIVLVLMCGWRFLGSVRIFSWLWMSSCEIWSCSLMFL